MRRLSIQALKASLSNAVAAAEAGETLVITRHSEPVAQLTPVREVHVRRGRQVGTGRLQPAVRRGTGGRYLAVLLEDRGER